MIIYLIIRKKQKRYISVLIKRNFVILLILSTCISYIYVTNTNKRYASIKEKNNEKLVAIIKSDPEEKKYTYSYIAEIENLQGIKRAKVNLYVKKDKANSISHYGDKISFNGEIVLPEEARNFEGFDEQTYCKCKGIYCSIYTEKVKKIGYIFCIDSIGNSIRECLKEKIRKYLKTECANILIGILIGDKNEIDTETILQFRKSNIIHIICISGAHVTFIMVWLWKVLNSFGRKTKYTVSLLALLCFLCIIDFSPSATRACIMGMMLILSKLLLRSPDTPNAISLSLLILLIYNPYLILDTGVLLSYSGTIGILCYEKIILKKMPYTKGKIMDYIKNNIAVSLSAQVMLFPIVAFLFCTYHPLFFISCLIATPLFEAILLLRIYIYIFFIYSSANLLCSFNSIKYYNHIFFKFF